MPASTSSTGKSSLDALATLLTRTLDALEGYETMVEKAEPQFRPVAEQFRALHADHAEKLAAMMQRLGQTPDLGGSFMGTMDKAVVTLAAFFGAIDQHEMKHIRSGEQSVLQGFAAVAEGDLPAPERDRVLDMQAQLIALLEQTKDLG